MLVAGGLSGLMLPVEPHGSFELRSRFYRQQNNGGAVKFWLPVGTGQASLVLNGQNSRHGIEWLDGERLGRASGAMAQSTSFGENEKHEVIARIQRHEHEVSVQVTLDANELFEWQGAGSRIVSRTFEIEFPNPDVLALGNGRTPGVVWESLELRMIEGKAKVLRPRGPEEDRGDARAKTLSDNAPTPTEILTSAD